MSLKQANKGDKQPRLVWWPVTLYEPKDGGRSTQHLVDVQYELLSQAEKDQAASGGDVEFLQRVVRDWKKFEEADGTPIPCTEESRADFFETGWIMIGIVQGYFLANAGGRRKNS